MALTPLEVRRLGEPAGDGGPDAGGHRLPGDAVGGDLPAQPRQVGADDVAGHPDPAVGRQRVGAGVDGAAGAVQADQAVADPRADLGVEDLLRREGAGRHHQAEVGGDVEVGELQRRRRPGHRQVGVAGEDGDHDAVVPDRDDLAAPRRGPRPVRLALGDRPALAVRDERTARRPRRPPRCPPGRPAGWWARSAAAPAPRTTRRRSAAAPTGSGRRRRGRPAAASRRPAGGRGRPGTARWPTPRVRRSERLLMVPPSLRTARAPHRPGSGLPRRPGRRARHARRLRPHPRAHRRRLPRRGPRHGASTWPSSATSRAGPAARSCSWPGSTARGRQRRAGPGRRLRRGHGRSVGGRVPHARGRPGGARRRRRRAAGHHLPGPGAGGRQARRWCSRRTRG